MPQPPQGVVAASYASTVQFVRDQAGPDPQKLSFWQQAWRHPGVLMGLAGVGGTLSRDAPVNGFTFASRGKLSEHFGHHGAELGFETEEQYLAGARAFVSRGDPSVRIEVRASNGDVVIYNRASQEFAVVRRNGTIRTYFVPNPVIH